MNIVTCNGCKISKPMNSFALRNEKYRNGKRRKTCIDCQNSIKRKNYENLKTRNFFKHKASRAKVNAKIANVPFNLDEEYLKSIWVDHCPVLGTLLDKTAPREDEGAVELDRFVPELGYVRGNVAFLSRKANRIKNNSTIEILENLLKWMKEFESNKSL